MKNKKSEYYDQYVENDKWNAPFLLAASFQNFIQFTGSFTRHGILYWQFSPKDKAQYLIEQFHTKTNPPIPAQDLFEAINVFWQQIAKTKEMKYGESNLGK